MGAIFVLVIHYIAKELLMGELWGERQTRENVAVLPTAEVRSIEELVQELKSGEPKPKKLGFWKAMAEVWRNYQDKYTDVEIRRTTAKVSSITSIIAFLGGVAAFFFAPLGQVAAPSIFALPVIAAFLSGLATLFVAFFLIKGDLRYGTFSVWLLIFLGLATIRPYPWWNISCFLIPVVVWVWLALRIRAGKEGERVNKVPATPESLQQMVLARLRQIVNDYRNRITGSNSEFGQHLASREQKLEEAKSQVAYWAGRKQTNGHTDPIYFDRRLNLAKGIVKVVEDDVTAFRAEKQQILDGLRALEARLPEVEGEITDHFHDRALEALSEEAVGFRAESEALVLRTVAEFSREAMVLEGALEKLRLHVLPALDGREAIPEVVKRAELIGATSAALEATAD